MPTVLLIEDDDEARRATSDLFSREKWNVFEAGDGESGIALALKHRPEVILCDLLMPKANGFQVCRAIRQQLQRTKIIVVSGRDYGVDRASAIDAGADEYLVKPITWELLSSTIERILPELPRKLAPINSVDFHTPATRLKLWGVRGSIPVPGPTTVRYGGNTSCIEVRADGEIIILDAGSGIRALGMALEQEFGERRIDLTLLLTHTHWDHIQGLPFFLPAYNEKNQIHVLGYEGARAGLAAILAGQMETPFFPVSLRDLPSNIAIEELQKMEFAIGRVQVRSKFANHPGICAGYRLYTSGGSIAYFPDNEPYELLKLHIADRDQSSIPDARAFAKVERAKLVDFLSDVDVLIVDAQYTDEEYRQHIGWGHGALSRVVSLALEARAKKLILFHHDPAHDDEKIDEMLEGARLLVVESGKPLEVEAAREGAEIWLAPKQPASEAERPR
ncbi:MAG TPA: response regulator [Chthoniobacterales bacterium]|nr:response regulator [Chthoniobacterales bacterium]